MVVLNYSYQNVRVPEKFISVLGCIANTSVFIQCPLHPLPRSQLKSVVTEFPL